MIYIFHIWKDNLINGEKKNTEKASDTLQHQPTVWPVPNAYGRIYHSGSCSHRQPFRPCMASSINGVSVLLYFTMLGESVVYLFCTQVVFTAAIRAKRYHDQIPPHNFDFKQNAADPYERQIGTQVLMDILLLAKCDHFLHTESSVASLASYFNPHMTSYFLQDEKHVKVC